MKIVLMGPPSWGSGSHRVRIHERYPLLCYANAQELLRTEIQTKTPFGVEAANQMRAGTPVSDDQLMSLVLRYLRTPACAMGFILEGMPRSPEQAERLLEDQRRVDAVVEVLVPDEEVLKRTSGRLVHRPSGRIYHDIFAPPRVPGKDDQTGEPLTRRLDDDPAVAKERLARYRNGIDAVKRYFKGVNPFPEGENQQVASSITTTISKSTETEVKTADVTTATNNNTSSPDSTSSTTGASAVAPIVPEVKPKIWKFPSRLPVYKEVSGKGTTEEVRLRLFSTLDELVGKRATGPHQQRFWWSWFS
jgi:adenylate kinase